MADREVSDNQWYMMTYSAQKCFTGVVKSDYGLDYIVDGKTHRDLAPARVYYDGSFAYFLHGWYYDEKAYWTKMYEKYKGTEHEGLCLSHVLLVGGI